MQRAYYNEIDPFCVGVLKRRVADGSLPPGDIDDRDIRSVQASDLREYGQVHLFAGVGGFALAARIAGWPDGRPLWTGGYPCQPFSLAGLRRGTSDDRDLWPECARLLGAVADRPAWCVFENVDGHRDLGLDRTLLDLEVLGYAGRPTWIPACGVGAPHDRMRVWIAARWLADAGHGQLPEPGRRPQGRDGAGPTGAPVVALADATGERSPIRQAHAEDGGAQREAAQRAGMGGRLDAWKDFVWIDCADGRIRRTEPGLGLLAHGIPDRVARLRALGNAIVPQVAARVLNAILRSEAAS